MSGIWVQRRPGMGRVAESASPASRLPQVMGAVQARDGAGCRIIIAGKPAPTGIGCSAGQVWGRLQGQHRRQPAPTGNGCSAGLVGAGLPGMGQVAGSASPVSRLPQVSGAAQARDGAGCRFIIAGKPAPTGIGCSTGQGWGRLQDHHRRQPAPRGIGCSAGLVGAGLPGMGQVAGSSSPAAGSHR